MRLYTLQKLREVFIRSSPTSATTLSTRACRKELTSLVAFPDTDTTGRVFYKSSRASVRHISPYSVDSGRTPV